MTERELMWFFLASLTAMSSRKKQELLTFFGTIDALYHATKEELAFSGTVVTDREYGEMQDLRSDTELAIRASECEKRSIGFVSMEDPLFPERLLDLEDVPAGLFFIGKLPDSKKKTVSIVGSRRCSPYGRECAEFFAKRLSEQGVQIVSGMALGIDGHAGRGALCGAGGSFAVLGSGIDRCYPIENLDLYRDLSLHGGILSERPPGYVPKAYDFPLRNRIISVLSDVTLVIEASERSGSLITAEWASRQNRDVFAVPGRITDAVSFGCNQLIRDGAFIATCPEDVLSFLGVKVGADTKRQPSVSLSKEEAAVYDLLSKEESFVETLTKKSSIPVSELLSVLVRLEIKGLVKRGGFGGYQKT